MTNTAKNNVLDIPMVDVLIIGAGPAGLSAAMQAKKRQISHLVLEASKTIAHTIHSFAGGKWIMDEPVKIPHRSGLLFNANTKETLIDAWSSQVDQYALDIQFGQRVESITGSKGAYLVRTESQCTYRAKSLVLAFGVEGKPVLLPEDIDPKGIANYSIPQKETWSNQRILVVGAGDSAVEEALLLAKTNHVFLLNRRDSFERCKAANKALINKAIEHKEIVCAFNSELISISPSESTTLVARFKTNKTNKIGKVDKVLVRIGTQSTNDFFSTLGLNLAEEANGRLHINEYGETSEQGVYVIGSVSGQALIKQGMNQGVICVEHLSGYPVIPTELMVFQQRLKAQGIKASARDVLDKINLSGLFKSVSKASLREVLMHTEVLAFDQSKEIVGNDEYCDDLFFVYSGYLNVLTQSQDSHRINSGETVGEITLLSQQASKYAIKAEKGSFIFKFPHYVIAKLAKQNTTFSDALLKQYLKRTLKWLMQTTIPDYLLELFIKKSKVVVFEKGQSVDRNGDLIFLMINGSVAVDEGNCYSLKQGGGQIGFREALEKQPIPGFQINQNNTRAWALPVSLISGFHTLNPQVVTQRIEAELGLVADPLPHKMTIVDTAKLDFYTKENLGNAGNVLVIDRDKCVGCNQCESACASTHNGVSRLNRKTGVLKDNLLVASACRHCKTPACLTDCPADAISRTASGEIIISDQCIGCGNCAVNCSYDVITITSDTGLSWFEKITQGFVKPKERASKAVKCDLCVSRKNGPACVQSCPTGAAKRLNPTHLIETVNI